MKRWLVLGAIAKFLRVETAPAPPPVGGFAYLGDGDHDETNRLLTGSWGERRTGCERSAHESVCSSSSNRRPSEKADANSAGRIGQKYGNEECDPFYL